MPLLLAVGPSTTGDPIVWTLSRRGSRAPLTGVLQGAVTRPTFYTWSVSRSQSKGQQVLWDHRLPRD